MVTTEEALALHYAQGGEPIGPEVLRVNPRYLTDAALETVLTAATEALGEGVSLMGGRDDDWVRVYHRDAVDRGAA